MSRRKTKRNIIAITAASAVALSGIFVISCNASPRPIKVTLNGQELSFEQQPVIADNTTLVPMREIFETLGMDVSWNEGSQTVTAVKNGKSAVVTVGSKTARINGETVQLTAAPVLQDGCVMVPLRVISEAMGIDVSWDADNYTVIMTDEAKNDDDSWKNNTGSIDLTSMTVDGDGLSVEDKVILVTKGGDYTVKGECSDAMIRVNANDSVKLRLEGVSLTNTDGPAIFFEQSEKSYITVSKGTENYLADGGEYAVDAKGTIFSNDDLEIKGGGTLTVTSTGKHAIASDDKISIENGILILNAGVDGIHANDGIKIIDGSVTVTATGDGIQSEGYIDISGGELNITTNGEVADSAGGFGGGFGGGSFGGGRGNDLGGRQGRTDTQNGFESQEGANERLTGPAQGGDFQPPEMDQGDRQPPEMGQGGFRPNQQGGSKPPEMGQEGAMQPSEGMPEFGGNEQTEDDSSGSSTKGIKAETNLIISGGTVTVNSADHALHCQGITFITGGKLNLTSQKGKGISSYTDLVIDGGDIDVLKSTEGLESKGNFSINGGTIHITASDDGINAGGTNGQDVGASGEHCLYINDGYIYVNAAGDGLDANGIMYLLGGTAIVDGPTNSGNGSLDSGGSIVQQGGTLIAIGSSGMAEYPRDNECTQPVISFTASQSQEAGSIVRIETADGEEMLTYRSSKQWQNLVFSSEELKLGETYRIITGGEYTGGAEIDGVLDGGSFSGGTAQECTLSSMSTVVGYGGSNRGSGDLRGGGMFRQ